MASTPPGSPSWKRSTSLTRSTAIPSPRRCLETRARELPEVAGDEAQDEVLELAASPKWASGGEKRVEPPPVDKASLHPPSFALSEFETIIRKQKYSAHGLKIVNTHPSRFPNLDNDWEFAGWGSTNYLELSPSEFEEAKKFIETKSATIDQWRATSIAGNGVIGSVFYAFPAVAAASGVLSPISLLIACSILFLFRPILLELGSAVRLNGANYTYLLQFSGKTLGLIGAAATLLDAMATSMVSTATAVAYLEGDVPKLGVSQPILALSILVALCLVGFFQVKESSIVTLTFTMIHLLSMTILVIFSIVAWSNDGTSTLAANWEQRPSSVGRAIFNGVCIGFLGVTGFECTPAYIEVIEPKDYSRVIRNLLWSAMILNVPLMLFVYVHLPNEDILTGANVLSLLAEKVAGKWLRILLVIDASLVLSGGVLTGLFTACGLLQTLAQDGVLPKLLLRTMPITGGPASTVIFFILGCTTLYASSAFKLPVISSVFSVSFLTVMILYIVSNVMLKFNRNRLLRDVRASPLSVFLAFGTMTTVVIGNVVMSPVALGLFVAYFATIVLWLFIIKSQLTLTRIALWIYDQIEVLRKFKYTKGVDAKLVKTLRRMRRHAIVVWVKGDDIHHLIDAILYVRRNEPTARIIFVHAYEHIGGIPTELIPNSKILDEAFPSITIDLTFVRGTFQPGLVEAASRKLEIPRTGMFMSCPGANHGYTVADYKGVRVFHH